MIKRLPLAAVLLAMATGYPALAEDTAAPLPGGASSLQETYRDWRVACAADAKAKRCALSQQQTQPDGQRILAIELVPAAEGQVTGTLVLPFGLQLDAGVALAVDDQPAAPPSRFSTCLPAGCLVPLAFDLPTLAALRAGSSLKLAAKANDGQDVALSISLAGLAPALDRLASLAAK
jgi:invasion protein IalB